MKIPLINSNDALTASVTKSLKKVNRGERRGKSGKGRSEWINLVECGDSESALEYINYQMPPLILLNFSGGGFDGFDLLTRIASDPWLNHGGVIAFYEGSETFDRLNEFKDANILITLSHGEVERQLETILKVIKYNQSILFQRAIQTDLVSSTAGRFVLDMDLLLVPCYANLISNYLFNVGFMDAESKTSISLVLTEMLINAIEHGNCAITSEEKTKHLKKHSTIHDLVRKKCRDKKISARKVSFSYDINRERSTYVIRDEGQGFDWKSYLDGNGEIDYLSEHGRGIMLSRQVVDRIAYNDSGNEVTLEIEHQSTKGMIPEAFRDNEVMEFKPNDIVFRQGEESDFLYYVAEGEYRVEVNRNHIANLTTDDILIGEMSFLLEETRSATVIANTPGRLIKISKEAFINILKNQPYYGFFLSKLIARRLHRLNRGEL